MVSVISTNFNSDNNINFHGNLKYLKITNYCINKIGHEITPENVKATPWYLKKIIKIFTPKRIKELAEINGYIAKTSKMFFDKKFGEGNYTVIALGRSVASIAENMKFLGVDAKIIPMSGLRKGLPNNIKNVEIYKNYLKSINLDEKSIDNAPNKKFILFDYRYTGNTLNAAEKFFNKYIFKEKKKNFISFSINEILNNNGSFQKIRNLFVYNRFKQFSLVGKLDINDLGECEQQANLPKLFEYTSSIAKNKRNLFLFNIINNLSNENFSYPKAEFEVIKKRYMSQKAELRLLNKMIAVIDKINTKNLHKFN